MRQSKCSEKRFNGVLWRVWEIEKEQFVTKRIKWIKCYMTLRTYVRIIIIVIIISDCTCGKWRVFASRLGLIRSRKPFSIYRFSDQKFLHFIANRILSHVETKICSRKRMYRFGIAFYLCTRALCKHGDIHTLRRKRQFRYTNKQSHFDYIWWRWRERP